MARKHVSPSRVGRTPRTRTEAFGRNVEIKGPPVSRRMVFLCYAGSIVAAVSLALMLLYG